MSDIKLVEREMTADELARMNAGFDEHARDNGVEIQSSERFGFVALDGERFIGCSSGLAYKNGSAFSGWFYLSDLFVEKPYRRQGIASKLLAALEAQLLEFSVDKVWTWTAGYEGPEFYLAQGYEVIAEMENWYSNGDSRVALRKNLAP